MTFAGFTGDQWLQIGLAVLVIVGVAVLVRILLTSVVRFLMNRVLGLKSGEIRREIIDPLTLPINLLAIVATADLAFRRLDFLPPPGTEAVVEDVFFALYVVGAFWLLMRLVGAVLEYYEEEIAPDTQTTADDQLVPFVRRLAAIVLGGVALIILFSRFNIDVSGLVAGLGITSLAIALAAQAALADTVSGFVIMADRPYRIGDRIEIQDLDTWGDVVDIGLRASRIRTRDNRMVIIPNSVMGKSLIVNHSYPDTQYRIQIEIGVAFGSDIEEVRRIIIDAVRGVPGVLPDKPVEALFLQWGDSALIFRVRWWLESFIDTRRMFDRVNTAMYAALIEAGVEVPNPTRDLYHKFEPEEAEKLAAALKAA